MALAGSEPDPSAAEHGLNGICGLNPQIRIQIQQVGAIVGPFYLVGCGDFAGTREEVAIDLCPRPIRFHFLQTDQGLRRPNQHGARLSFFQCGDVQHPVCPVSEIHVREPGRTVHHSIAGRWSPECVRARIIDRTVRLSFDNARPPITPHQKAAKQALCTQEDVFTEDAPEF